MAAVIDIHNIHAFSAQVIGSLSDFGTEVVIIIAALATHFLLQASRRSRKGPRVDKVAEQKKDDALGAALDRGDLNAAVKCFQELVGSWRSSASGIEFRQGSLQQLVGLASRDPSKLEDIVCAIEGSYLPISTETFNSLLLKVTRFGNPGVLSAALRMGHVRRVDFNVVTYCTMLRGATTQESMDDIFSKASTQNLCTQEFLEKAAHVAAEANHVLLAENVWKRLASGAATGEPNYRTVAAVIRTFGSCERADTDASLLACYERYAGLEFGSEAKVDRVVFDAALRCDAKSTIVKLFSSQPIAKCLASIRALAAAGRSDDAMRAARMMPLRDSSDCSRLVGLCVEFRWFNVAAYICGQALTSGLADARLAEPIVEGLSRAGDPEAAFNLFKSTLNSSASTKQVGNASMYLQMIRAFIQLGCFDRMWDVHQELRDRLEIHLPVSFYNLLLDACSKCQQMSRVKEVLAEMERAGVEASVVTVSAILKGYCQLGQLEHAFGLVEQMRKTTSHVPDQVMYNTLLEGCARQGLYHRGMEVLDEMLCDGISPSSYTLYPLIRLCHYGKLEKAFEVCEVFSQKFRVELTADVHSHLVQACLRHHDVTRALESFDNLIRTGARPDVRVYVDLLQVCYKSGHENFMLPAAELLRGAIGSKGPSRVPTRSLPTGLVTKVIDWIRKHDGALACILARDVAARSSLK